MASDNFSATNSPLASPWTGFGGSFGGLRSVSGGVRNVAGSDTDAGAYYSTSSATESSVDYVSGTTDGGPALHMGPGPDGYVITAYDGAVIYAFRLDDGSYSSELGHATGVYVAGQPTRTRRSSANLITSVAGVDILTVTDSTYTGGSPGIFSYAGNLIQDNWNDGASGTAYTLAIGQGSYSLSGQAVALRAARRITAAQGSYALNGQTVALRMARGSLAAQTGSYALNGQSVTLTGPEVSYSLSMEQGSYAYTGSDAAIDNEINIDSGSYALTGNAVGLLAKRQILASQGSYSLNGQAVGLRVARRISLSAGSYALNGQSVALTQHAPAARLTIETGIYSLSGVQVSLVYSGNDAFIIDRPFDAFNWWRH